MLFLSGRRVIYLTFTPHYKPQNIMFSSSISKSLKMFLCFGKNHDFMFFQSFLFIFNIVFVFINLILVYRLMFPALEKLRFVQPNIKQLTYWRPLLGKDGLEEEWWALEHVVKSCPFPLAEHRSWSQWHIHNSDIYIHLHLFSVHFTIQNQSVE